MKLNFSNPLIPRPFRIDEFKRESHDVFTLTFHVEDSSPGISFEPGQFNMLYVHGVGEVPVSLSSDPSEPRVLSHTVRSVGTVTNAMNKLKEGDFIGIRGPFGNSWPLEKAVNSDVLMVAGGIGFAPLKSLMHRIASERNRYGNVVLLYGTRTPDDIIFRNELIEWSDNFGIKTHITVDISDQDWNGNVGVVTTLIKKAEFDPSNTAVFICGPEVMMRYTVLELQKLSMDEDNIFISMERNMKCAVGFCGRCQYGPNFICKDGPVFRYSDVRDLLQVREL